MEQPLVQDEGQRLLQALLPPTYVHLVGGGAVQATRSIFALECAEELGAKELGSWAKADSFAQPGVAESIADKVFKAKDEARSRLALSASIGSLGELVLGPLLGKLSDHFGRRPLFLFYALIPTLTRAASALPWGSRGCLRCLYVDYALLRAAGVQAMMSTGHAMISDAVKPSGQTSARSQLVAALALGAALGNYAGGKLTAVKGPRATYVASVAIGAAAWAYWAKHLPETHKDVDQVAAERKGAAAPAKSLGGTFRVLAADAECRFLALALALHEFCNIPQFNEVHVLFAKESLSWGPEAIGAFTGIYGITQFLGSLATPRLSKMLGPALQVSVSHLSLTAAFVLWGRARSARGMAAVIPPLMLGFGRAAVLMNRLISRAAQLGLGKGETVGVLGTLASLAKACTPVMTMAIYSRMAKQRAANSKLRLPAGAAFFALALMGLAAEACHQASLRAARKRLGWHIEDGL